MPVCFLDRNPSRRHCCNTSVLPGSLASPHCHTKSKGIKEEKNRSTPLGTPIFPQSWPTSDEVSAQALTGQMSMSPALSEQAVWEHISGPVPFFFGAITAEWDRPSSFAGWGRSTICVLEVEVRWASQISLSLSLFFSPKAHR